ncbi:hypothetical protein [Bacillus pumilus]|uniref:hypothetical protein n=1 Tax=Bacillus pumilus TaxID=1408 RepID=UPI0011A16E4B|nr:hypothetical protein [Bacillus pumilus]
MIRQHELKDNELLGVIKDSIKDRRLLNIVKFGAVDVGGELVLLKEREEPNSIMGFICINNSDKYSYETLQGSNVIFGYDMFNKAGQEAIKKLSKEIVKKTRKRA